MVGKEPNQRELKIWFTFAPHRIQTTSMIRIHTETNHPQKPPLPAPRAISPLAFPSVCPAPPCCWPTYYYNVFQVELTEYVEPTRLQTEHSLVLATEVLSVSTEKPVWAIDAASEFVVVQEDGLDYQIFVREARAIVDYMARDGLVKRR